MLISSFHIHLHSITFFCLVILQCLVGGCIQHRRHRYSDSGEHNPCTFSATLNFHNLQRLVMIVWPIKVRLLQKRSCCFLCKQLCEIGLILYFSVCNKRAVGRENIAMNCTLSGIVFRRSIFPAFQNTLLLQISFFTQTHRRPAS